MATILDQFDQVRIINLADRDDRRREVMAQLARIGADRDPRVSLFTATRPTNADPFPSIGARGCFESHHAVVRDAIAAGANRLLIIEDDLDFVPDIDRRGPVTMVALASRPWDIFFGTPEIATAAASTLAADEAEIADAPPDCEIVTASCVGFGGAALRLLEPFLTAMMARPAGSPDYGPMHVDGAYSVFRRQHPQLRTFVCKPPIGRQRSSRSDITPTGMILDRFAATRPVANLLRRAVERARS